MAQLPLYYKNSKPTGPKSTTKRWKEYYLLVITIVGFIILIAGVLWFVPGMEEDKNFNKAYDLFTAPEDGQVKSTGKPTMDSDILRRDVEDPRGRKLEEKISVPEPNMEDKHPPKEKEDTPVENNDEEDMKQDLDRVSEKVVDEKVQVEVNDQVVSYETEETRQRREKVVSVSLL